MTAKRRRILLFGGSGQVGRALQAHAPVSWDMVAPGSTEASFLEPDTLLRTVEIVRPDLIVNAAAYTRVDDAEQDHERANRINAEAPAVLADYSNHHSIGLVHLSTDYVFDGATAPIPVDHPTAPINAYGRSKQSGEMLVLRADPDALVIRTSWVHDGSGANFVGTAVRTLIQGTSMRVVDDQLGVPTHADTVAEAIVKAVELRSLSGIEHVTDAGVASWYDVATCVLLTLISCDAVPAGTQVIPISTDEFPRPARRPRLSVLDTHGTRRRLGWSPPHWQYGVMKSTAEWLRHHNKAAELGGRT